MATKQDILDMISRLPDSVNSFGALNNDEFFRQMVAFIDTKKDSVVEVPKWLTYKALLTQFGEDAPVARVLNQDEADYLGDYVWSVVDADVNQFKFIGTCNGSNPANLTIPLITLYDNLWDIGRTIVPSIKIISDNEIQVCLSNVDGLYTDFVNLPIEIKVRQRGTPPKLLSAETNTVGNRIILTFDKRMSGYDGSDGSDLFKIRNGLS